MKDYAVTADNNKKLKADQKKSDMERYRDILFATIDYYLERYRGILVVDGADDISDSYEQQRVQIEKYFKQGRLDRMQKKLATLTREMEITRDLKFAHYVKEKTGYEFDIFEDLRKRVDRIIAQGTIANDKECADISSGIRLLEKTSGDPGMIEKMKILLIDYSKRNRDTVLSAGSGASNTIEPEVIDTIEKDGLIITRISIGSKPDQSKQEEAIAPDGKRKVVVTWNHGKYAITYVTITFPDATTVIYGATGICPDVRASWKDNTTVMITTKKDYKPNAQHKEVRSFDDVIKIEYTEQ